MTARRRTARYAAEHFDETFGLLKKARSKRTPGSETALVAGILKALALRNVFAWRANAGNIVIPATHKTQRRIIRGSTPGTPDILLVTPIGRLCGLEVKTAHGVLRESQARWHYMASVFSVRTAVVRTIRDAMVNIDLWLLEDTP